MQHFALIAMLLCGRPLADPDPILSPGAGVTSTTEHGLIEPGALTCHMCAPLAKDAALSAFIRFRVALAFDASTAPIDQPDAGPVYFRGQNADWSFARVAAAVKRSRQLPRVARWRAKGNSAAEAIDPADPIQPVARSDLPAAL